MKVGFFVTIGLSVIIVFSSCSSSKKNIIPSMSAKQNELVKLMEQFPQYFDSIMKRKDELKVQIIYSQIDRKANGEISFNDFDFNVNDSNYYYPASTVKLPVAILALQRLNEMKIGGLNKNTTMITGAEGNVQTKVYTDSTSPDNRATIAHYIKKILLVSDNDAFNRLYEFLGQEYINKILHKMGYKDVQIIHRLDISLSEENNRHTNPVNFHDSLFRIIYAKPAETSKLVYAERNTKIGRGYRKGDNLVNEPLDFSKKNRLPISYLHNIVKSVLFPGSVPAHQRFNLTDEDYQFLRRYMSMFATESKSPVYDTVNYSDTYVKFLFYGAEKNTAQPTVRSFNKPGDAYGFMIDGAYIADFKNNVEFILSAVIYCNSDGILNDDNYDYQTLGLPFMKHLGRVIHEHELKRKRTIVPDLSTFQFNYSN